VKGKLFRIGHIGHFNDLMLMGTLSGVEMGLDLASRAASLRRRARCHEVLKGRDMFSMPKTAVA